MRKKLNNTCGFQLDYSYLDLPTAFYTKIKPTEEKSPTMVILNEQLANSLGLDFSDITLMEQAKLFSGNIMPAGVEPFAQAYTGH